MHIRRFVPSLALVISIAASGHSLAQEKPEPQKLSGKIDWVYDYEEGKRLSETTGKPMFVVFRCER